MSSQSLSLHLHCTRFLERERRSRQPHLMKPSLSQTCSWFIGRISWTIVVSKRCIIFKVIGVIWSSISENSEEKKVKHASRMWRNISKKEQSSCYIIHINPSFYVESVGVHWTCVFGNKYCDSVERCYGENDQKKKR